MEQKILRDLYCFQCCLQFEKKSLYDIHQLIIHNYDTKTLKNAIKCEPEEIELLNHSSDIQLEHTEEQELIENEASISEGKTSLVLCEFCEKSFSNKQQKKSTCGFSPRRKQAIQM